MDALRKAVEKKRAATAELRNAVSGAKKSKSRFVRRGDIERARLDQAATERAAKDAVNAAGRERRADERRAQQNKVQDEVAEGEEEETLLSIKEIFLRLREHGEPVTLFAETAVQRYKRLRSIEREEGRADGHLALDSAYTAGSSKGGGGEDVDADEEDDDDFDDHTESAAADSVRAALSAAGRTGGTAADAVAAACATRDGRPESKEKHVYRFLKRMLREWTQELAERPDTVKRSAQGKIATKTHKQCKDYIRPLFKMLKAKQVAPDILQHVDKIVRLCEEREYVQATDWYVRLAIGNSPWPIGVTMVGIHERGGREKINESKTAHVMNDEMQRKYITSVKRIMTFCQNKYPADPSKMLSYNPNDHKPKS